MFTTMSRSYKLTISPEILKILKDSTNKTIERYKNHILFIKDNNDKPNLYALLPFVSFVSFLAGYKLNTFLTKV